MWEIPCQDCGLPSLPITFGRVQYHFYLLGCFIVVDSPPVKEEPKRRHRHSNSLGVRFLEFAHLSGHLDTEVNLVGVLADHLQFDVLSLASCSFAALKMQTIDNLYTDLSIFRGFPGS